MVPAFPRVLAAWALGLAAGVAGRADGIPANALGWLDAYLVQAARSQPAARTDLVLGDAPNPPSGRFLAVSSWLGPFTYRPKTYRELSAAERAALLRDPAWAEFLAAHRPAPAPAGSGAPPDPVRRFSVAPGEILRAGVVRIDLPPP